MIVVDNDADQRAGEAVVRAMSPQFPFPLTCIVEPRRGQTYAYNTAFAAACRMTGTDYIAVLDDDEYPAPSWLTEMIATAIRYEADIVGGPVFPVFEYPGHWLAKSGLYAPRRYVTGPIEMIYGAGSMLIRRDVLTHYLDEPFTHAFAFTGGSDYEFFTRCRRDGRSFAWADEAHVFDNSAQPDHGALAVAALLPQGHRGDPHRKAIFAGPLERDPPLRHRHRPDRLWVARRAGRGMLRPCLDHGKAARRRQGRRAPRGRTRRPLRGISGRGRHAPGARALFATSDRRVAQPRRIASARRRRSTYTAVISNCAGPVPAARRNNRTGCIFIAMKDPRINLERRNCFAGVTPHGIIR